MSVVSSIGSSGQGLYRFIQNLSAGGSLSAAPSSATDSTNSTAASGAQSTQAGAIGGHHHHHHGGGLFQQIESAVSSALQSAQSSGSSTDPNQIIQDAISKVIKNQQNQSASGTNAAANGAQPTGSDPDGDGDTHSAGQAGSAGSSAQQAFFQTLQSLGVSPQQFHSDFLAAIQNAQNGQVDVGTAMKSFPPGSTVDTLA